MFGYVPSLLRKALASLEAGPAGEVMHAIDRLLAGLAADLRRSRRRVGDGGPMIAATTDAMLAPWPPRSCERRRADGARLCPRRWEEPRSSTSTSPSPRWPPWAPRPCSRTGRRARRALADVRDAAATVGRHGAGSLAAAASVLERTELASIT